MKRNIPLWIVLTICLFNSFEVSAGEKSTTLESPSQISPKSSSTVDVLILGQMGYHVSQMSYGAMLGISKGHSGGYIKFMSDFNSVDTVRECNNDGYEIGSNEIIYFYDEAKKERMSITVGYIYNLPKPTNLSLYGGLGYGYRTLAWKDSNKEWVKATERSFKGVAADLGAMYKVGPIAISAGVTSVEFKYSELNIGVGYIF